MKKLATLKKLILFLVVAINAFGFRMMGLNYNKSLEGGYREFTIHNDGMKRERYKISLTPIGDEDITKYLEVYPKVVTIEPMSYKVFKVFGTAKEPLPKKEYQFSLNFTPIVVPTIKKYEGNAVSGTATMGFAPSLEMRAYGGQIDYENDVKVEGLTFSKVDGKLRAKGKVVNKSQGTLELGVILGNKDGNVFMSKALNPIRPNAEEYFDEEITGTGNPKDIKQIELYDETRETVGIIEITNN